MRLILASLATSGLVPVFDTNAGGKLYVCDEPQQDNLTAVEYAALDWVLVGGVGNHGETGSNTNILTYDTWDDEVVQKSKGMTNAGDPEIEVARRPTDAGQLILREAAESPLNYAFKIVKNNPATSGGVGTIRYNRGLVTGPRHPNGRNEDFELEIYTLGLNQKQIVVEPT